MPITFDTTGYRQQDQNTWIGPTGDRITLSHFDGVSGLPLGDLARLRHDLALRAAETGCLIEAQVVQLGGVPAVLQISKLPIANRPGQMFGCTFTVPGAHATAVLGMYAEEHGTTGMREGVLAAEIGFQRWIMPHPYAPQLQGKLPFHAGDDPRFDSRFPEHPLSRVRRWAHHVVRTARVDPAFGAQAQQPAPTVQAPVPQPAPTVQAPVAPPSGTPPLTGASLMTASVGIVIRDFVALQIGTQQSYWRMTDGLLREKLGRGVMGRVPLTDTRFRDMILIDVQSGHAMVPDRYTTDGAMTGTGTRLEPITLQEANDTMTDEDIVEAYKWVGRMIAEARDRSEYLTLEPLENEGESRDPYVLMGIQNLEGEVVVVASCSPTPSENTPFRGNPGLNAPASPETIERTGVMAMYAMNEWNSHPLRMAVTFNRYPEQQAAPQPTVQANPNMVSATVGIPVKNFVGLQIGGQRTYWRMTDNVLVEKLGHGVMGRSPLTQFRFRDMILVDVQTGQAMVPDRYTTNGAMTGTPTRLEPVTFEQAQAELTSEECLQAFYWAARMVGVAAERGEWISVEPGVNEGDRAEPDVLLATQQHEGEQLVLAVAAPTPAMPPYSGNPKVVAPAGSIEDIAVLMMVPVSQWPAHALSLALTFIKPAD